MLLSRLDTPRRHEHLLQHPVWQQALEGLAALKADAPDATLDWHPGGALYVMIQGYTTHSALEAARECRFEAHKRFIDIQLLLAGEEAIDIAPVHSLKADGPFDAERDVGFFLTPDLPATRLVLRPGDFAVFFPDDAHRPKLAVSSPLPLRKAVVKIDLALLR